MYKLINGGEGVAKTPLISVVSLSVERVASWVNTTKKKSLLSDKLSVILSQPQAG